MIKDRIKELRRVKGSDLAAHPKNWRKHPATQKQAMESVLASVGWADAVLARETPDGLELIDGHLRSDMSPDDEIPVLILDVDEHEAEMILATHDPLAAMAQADQDGLQSLLADFDDSALKSLVAESEGIIFDDKENEIEDVEPQLDKLDELQEKWKCELGQIWAIGDHRLMCGDSTNEAHVMQLLDGSQPFLMVTDPPYGVKYDPQWRQDAADAGHLSYVGLASNYSVGKVENDDRVNWKEAYDLFAGDVAYTWSPPGDHVIETGSAIRDSGFDLRCMIMWRKTHFAISRGAYHYQHEPCWYAVRTGKKAEWIGDRSQSTVWDIPHAKNETGHGTQKPLECMARPIRHHKTEAVYDPFLGSGTTMLASHQLKRRCFGMEISPEYCAVILQRMTDAGCTCKLE